MSESMGLAGDPEAVTDGYLTNPPEPQNPNDTVEEAPLEPEFAPGAEEVME